MSAALTTQGAKNLRPAAVLAAVLLAAAVLAGLVGLAGSRIVTSQQPAPGAAHPLVTRGTTVSTGIPYVGTGSAAETIRNGYVGTQVQVVPSAVPGTTVPTEIPYVGTGPAAETIRASSGASKPAYTWSWNAGR